MSQPALNQKWRFDLKLGKLTQNTLAAYRGSCPQIKRRGITGIPLLNRVAQWRLAPSLTIRQLP